MLIRLPQAIVIAIVLAASPADAQQDPPATPAPQGAPASDRLGLFLGLGYLGSLPMSGVVIPLGLRYRATEHIAVAFDLGYGVIGRPPDVQDRWWLIPSIAWTTPAGPAQLDVGAGLGLGATSGYRDLPAYVAAPFTPEWALQLVPTLRAHATATTPLTDRLDLFARFDVASLLTGGNSIGSRVANPHPRTVDQIWYELAVGVQLPLL